MTSRLAASNVTRKIVERVRALKGNCKRYVKCKD
jgi:hypothetical protein